VLLFKKGIESRKHSGKEHQKKEENSTLYKDPYTIDPRTRNHGI
jgi:hypothetical protein